MGGALVEEQRSYRRAATMFNGEISAGDTSWPAKIRDISAYGALVQSDAIAHEGASVELIRGPRRVAGEVRWRGAGALGIRFAEPVNVEEWLECQVARGLSSRQENLPNNGCRHPQEVLPSDVIAYRVREEMAFVSRLIDGVAELLSEDPILHVRHATHLQELCMGRQMLNELINVLELGCSADAVLTSVSGPMQQRLVRAQIPEIGSCR